MTLCGVHDNMHVHTTTVAHTCDYPLYLHRHTSTVHTAHRDEPNMDDQPNNTLSRIKLMKSESSEHIVKCGKRFILTSQLDRHVLHQHLCPECDKMFAQAGILTIHMLTHTGENQHACPDCDKRFLYELVLS